MVVIKFNKISIMNNLYQNRAANFNNCSVYNSKNKSETPIGLGFIKSITLPLIVMLFLLGATPLSARTVTTEASSNSNFSVSNDISSGILSYTS